MTAGLEQVAPLLGRALGAWRVPVVGQLVSAAVSLTTSRICYLTLYRIYATYRISLAHRGASPETVPLAERGVASRGLRLVTLAPGGPGPRPPGTTTWPRGARSTDPEAMPETTSAAPGQKSPRWSAERRASSRWRAQGASQAPGVPRKSASLDALRHAAGAAAPERRLGAPPPLGVDEGKVQAPGAKRVAGTRRCARREWRTANRGKGVFYSLFATRDSPPGYLTS